MGATMPRTFFLLLFLIALVFENCAYAKKDFRGLFGSYRREKFTENEATSGDFGVDVLLSSLIPLTPIVKSSTSTTSAGEPMNYATFFNFELNFFYTLYYEWELFFNIANYSYETRKLTNEGSDGKTPIFHHFEMDVNPAMLGAKYRFSTSDIVPYAGASLGLAYVKRKGYYDNNLTIFNEQYLTSVVGQLMAGVEFFFAPRAGIRFEVAAHYLQLPEKTYDDPSATDGMFPVMTYQSSPWSFRYASGLFFMF